MSSMTQRLISKLVQRKKMGRKHWYCCFKAKKVIVILKPIKLSLFQSQESVVREVQIVLLVGKTIEHMGVKIELLGQIELYFVRGNFYDVRA